MEMDTSEAHSRKNRGLIESHPGAVSTGDNPKAGLAQNPENSTEKNRESFFPRRTRDVRGVMEGHHTGSAPASTWGCVDVPAGPGVGWDIPGAAWTSVGGEGEMGGREVGLWMCHLCPSEFFHGWDKMSLDMTPARHRGTRSHQRAVVVDTGPWSGHPCPGTLCLDTPQPLHGLLFPCGIWPSGAGPGGMG